MEELEKIEKAVDGYINAINPVEFAGIKNEIQKRIMINVHAVAFIIQASLKYCRKISFSV